MPFADLRHCVGWLLRGLLEVRQLPLRQRGAEMSTDRLVATTATFGFVLLLAISLLPHVALAWPSFGPPCEHYGDRWFGGCEADCRPGTFLCCIEPLFGWQYGSPTCGTCASGYLLCADANGQDASEPLECPPGEVEWGFLIDIVTDHIECVTCVPVTYYIETRLFSPRLRTGEDHHPLAGDDHQTWGRIKATYR